MSLHADYSFDNHLYPLSGGNSSGSHSRPTLLWPQLSKKRNIEGFSFLATLLQKRLVYHFLEKIYPIVALSAMVQCMYSALWKSILTDHKEDVFPTHSLRLSLLLRTWLLCCAHLSASVLYSWSQPRNIYKGMSCHDLEEMWSSFQGMCPRLWRAPSRWIEHWPGE